MSPPSSDETWLPRATCYDCFRPQELCYCEQIQPIRSRTQIVIVQHPREEFHPLNTARLVERGLTSCQVLRGDFDKLNQQLLELSCPEPLGLLFPSADSRDLFELPPEERPATLVVLDGTWHHAKRLLQDLPALQHLPRYRFTPTQPSEYRIRKEPREDYLSTLESVAISLENLEPELSTTPLRNLFRELIDRNIAARKPGASEKRFRVRSQLPRHRFAPELFTDASRVVLAYAEGAPQAGPLKNAPVILRLQRATTSSTEALELILAAPTEPHERLLRHLGLSLDSYRKRRIPPAEAQARLANWVQPEDVIFAWNSTSLSIAQEFTAFSSSCLLKSCYLSWKRFLDKKQDFSGGLEAALQREHCTDPSLLQADLSIPGRATVRLQQTAWITRWLQAQARQHLQEEDTAAPQPS